VILLILLRVVLDEFLDVDLDEVDLGEDFVGGGGPGERLGVAVPVSYVGFTRTAKLACPIRNPHRTHPIMTRLISNLALR
jgi:hypothetical protein